MKLTFLGAAQTASGTRILFEHDSFSGLIDCGLFLGPKSLRHYNRDHQEQLKKAQAVILTHAHLDHSGYLPRFTQHGFRGPIYCSEATADLLPVILKSSAQVEEEDAHFANQMKHCGHNPASPLFVASEVSELQKWIHPIRDHEWHSLTSDLSFRLYRSGHFLGSSLVQLAVGNRNHPQIVTFTSDLGSSTSSLIRDAENILETDVLVLEATYGARALQRHTLSKNLQAVINQVIERRGTLVVPAFPVGLTQELMLLISRLKKEIKIPDVPVYLDSPMSAQIPALYQQHIEELKDLSQDDIEESFGLQVCQPVVSSKDSMRLTMSDEPKIVIAASPILQGGRVLQHLKAKLPNPKNGVLFIDYQPTGTKGRLLKDGLNTIVIEHVETEVAASVFSLEGISTHADSNEILGWLRHFHKPPKQVLIHHGEREACEALAYRIRNELRWPHVLAPVFGECFDLKILDHSSFHVTAS